MAEVVSLVISVAKSKLQVDQPSVGYSQFLRLTLKNNSGIYSPASNAL